AEPAAVGIRRQAIWHADVEQQALSGPHWRGGSPGKDVGRRDISLPPQGRGWGPREGPIAVPPSQLLFGPLVNALSLVHHPLSLGYSRTRFHGLAHLRDFEREFRGARRLPRLSGCGWRRRKVPR